MPALDEAARRQHLCEGVQFVTSAFLRSKEEGEGEPLLSIFYGVNDCESAAITLHLSDLERLLEHS